MAKVSEGVLLAWRLAQSGAVAAGKNQVEVVQMFCAIIELDRTANEARLRKLEAPKPMSVNSINDELDRALFPLKRRAIDFGDLERRLTGQAGVGVHERPSSGNLRRSFSLRSAFDLALRFADEARRDGIELSDLLSALLEQPGSIARRVLSELGADVDRLALEIRLGGATDGVSNGST